MISITQTALIVYTLSAAFAFADQLPLADSLHRETHATVYLTAGKQGILAQSLSGEFRRTLVSGDVCSATYDASAQVIFYPRNDKLWALDLRQLQPRPVAVVALRGRTPKRHCYDYSLQVLDGRGFTTNHEAIGWYLDWKKNKVGSVPSSAPPVIVGTWLRDNATRLLCRRPEIPVRDTRRFGKTNMDILYQKDADQQPACLLRDRAGRLHLPEHPDKVFRDLSEHQSYAELYQFNESENAWILGEEEVCSPARGCLRPKDGYVLGWLFPGPLYFCPPDSAWRRKDAD